MDTNAAINKIYNERKDFIIIGLTGRTGSGCSTASGILKESNFDKLGLKSPKAFDFKNSEEIKYSILYNYAKSDNWNNFDVIAMSDIITSFIFEKGYEEFRKYLEGLFINKITINNKRSLYDSISILKEEIDKISEEMKKIDYTKNGKDDDVELIIDIYMNKVPPLTERLKEKLKDYNCNEGGKESQLYTYLFQQLGNNLRSSGNPFDTSFKADKFFTLAERTNSLIKAIRRQNKDMETSTLICIDAIRNPFEAIFFKDRYSAFHLISVSTDDLSRRNRLSHLRAEEIDSLDEIEYPEKLKEKKIFYNQDISACLEIADIHIYNPDIDENRYQFLTEQLLRYIILMIHPGLVTPTHIERCMQIAYNAKLNSGCLSRQVGAVVTGDDYSIKGIGWNDVPKGQMSCSLRDIKEYCMNTDRESYSHYEITDNDFNNAMKELLNKIDYEKLGGRKHPYCFKDIYNKLEDKDNQVYTRSLHAEENAFLQVAKYGGMAINGGFLFTTASPCELCAKKAYQLGIKKIYYIDPYPGISIKHILQFGSTGNPEMNLFFGAIGNAYISLYTPRMSYKDELEMVLGQSPKNILKSKKEKRMENETK